jgi:hypothetical protein
MSKSWDNYCETALWSSEDDQDVPLDQNYTVEDVVFNSKVATELETFHSKARDLFRDTDRENWEHDFWLTRNRHGAGFWDGDYIEGDKLTAIAKSYGEQYLYVGDDGKLYFERG